MGIKHKNWKRIDEGIDYDLLRWQADRLADIQVYLATGETFDNADEWHDSIEGILNLLAILDRESA